MPAPAQAPRHAVAYPRLNEDVGGISASSRSLRRSRLTTLRTIPRSPVLSGPRTRCSNWSWVNTRPARPTVAADPAVRRLPEAVSQPVKVVRIQSSVQWFKFLPQVLHELGNPFLGFWVPPHVQDKLLAGAAPLNIGVLIVATPEM